MSNQTIAAISTPNAPGGIGIIRISGDNAIDIAAKIFVPISGKNLTKSKGYQAHFGDIVYDGKKLDEGICLVFRAPHSYTGENVAEINCHGGLFLTKQILRAILENGAVPAKPGEFTKRAFLNGKMDLASSESVMALIGANSKQAAAAALNTLEGNLSKKINECCNKIVSVCASLVAWVDYPDEDIEEITVEEMKTTFSQVADELEKIVKNYDNGKALTQGVDTVIVGKPNVGKSAIMNLLAGYQRSIVTDIAGTTRDVVEESIVIDDILLKIADTAGIRDTENAVETIGVDLAKKRLERASLVLAVFDSSEPLSPEDFQIVEDSKDKKRVALLNKSDLPCVADIEKIKSDFDCVVELSALTGEGSDELEKALSKVLLSEDFSTDFACLTGERQRLCCTRAIDHLKEAIDGLNTAVTLDAINVCADCAVQSLLELTGETAQSAVVDEIFSRFCVGK